MSEIRITEAQQSGTEVLCPKGHAVPYGSCKYCAMLSDMVDQSRSELIKLIFQWHDALYRAEDKLSKVERELYGTPDNAVWSKQQWIENAKYWKDSHDKRTEERDGAVAQLAMSEIRTTEAPVTKGEREDTPEKFAALHHLRELQALAEDGLLVTHGKAGAFTFTQVRDLMAEFGLEMASELGTSNQWLLANLCERHADINTMSSGPCAMCRAESAESKLTDYDRVCDALAAAEKELAETGLKLRETAQQVLHLDTARVILIEQREELQRKLTALSAILQPIMELHDKAENAESFAVRFNTMQEEKKALRNALPELLKVMGQ